jgi:DNA-binding response OmpR family regulator
MESRGVARRVLLAEDEASIAESITFLLERAGFVVSVVTDGRKALDKALAEVPDVMVLDVMLPELDGYEILRQLRANDRVKALPVLMLTAKCQREDREMALKCGADLYITKPFANAEIVSAVRTLAERCPD